MATSTVRFTGGTNFSGTHVTGQKIYARSTDNSDDPQAVALYGDNTSDVMSKDAILIDGQAESLSATALNTLVLATSRYATGTAWNGDAQIYSNNGTAATGAIHVHAQPTDGDTLIIGLTSGVTTTYTFKNTV